MKPGINRDAKFTNGAMKKDKERSEHAARQKKLETQISILLVTKSFLTLLFQKDKTLGRKWSKTNFQFISYI